MKRYYEGQRVVYLSDDYDGVPSDHIGQSTKIESIIGPRIYLRFDKDNFLWYTGENCIKPIGNILNR